MVHGYCSPGQEGSGLDRVYFTRHMCGLPAVDLSPHRLCPCHSEIPYVLKSHSQLTDPEHGAVIKFIVQNMHERKEGEWNIYTRYNTKGIYLYFLPFIYLLHIDNTYLPSTLHLFRLSGAGALSDI